MMSRRLAVLGLAAAAAAGFRGALFNFGNLLYRYTTPTKLSTAQFSDARFPKHPPGTNAQARRAAIKAKNRAKHRAHMKGRA
jgi:hypothetical protein